MSKLNWILLLGVLFLFALYLPINIQQDRVYSFKTFIDDYIPLVTPFVVIYISYGLFLVYTFFYFHKKPETRILSTVLLSIIICCLVAYFIYLFFQNSIVRPEIVATNVFDETYKLINYFVAPYNAFPSLHVAISTVCAIGFWKVRSSQFKAMLFWAILIIFSTVLTKQHYFLDVLGGLVLAFLSFKIAEIVLKKADKSGRITQ